MLNKTIIKKDSLIKTLHSLSSTCKYKVEGCIVNPFKEVSYCSSGNKGQKCQPREVAFFNLAKAMLVTWTNT